MPGIFGQVGCGPEVDRRLRRAAERVWASLEWIELERGSLTAHSHSGAAIRTSNTRSVVRCADGEIGSYRHLAEDLEGPYESGIWTEVDLAAQTVEIRADPAGCFPFFYTEVNGGLAFSSLQHVLATAVQAERDVVGMLEYARFGAFLNGRSAFCRILRLLPGQTIRFDLRQGLTKTRKPSFWAAEHSASTDEAARAAWRSLVSAADRGIPPGTTVALMMSAGWDSRTLLAVLEQLSQDITVLCYSHGDLESRELRLARQITTSHGIRHLLQPIDERVLAPELTRIGFARTECLIFPYWLRAGRVLRNARVDAVTGGLMGAILGGHFGLSVTRADAGKARVVLEQLLGLSRDPKLSYEGILDLLSVERILPWYVNPEVIDPETYAQAINRDISASLLRLIDDGVEGANRLVEAFHSEYRSAQYMNAQCLSLRGWVDTTNPLASPETMQLAASLPIDCKIHNKVNRAMLKYKAADLLRFPMAATLVPASAPLLVQEASRAIRKIWESHGWRSYFKSAGRRPHPRLGWVNFEFFRDPDALTTVSDDLESSLWDSEAIQRLVGRAMGPLTGSHRLHSLFDQLGKLRTVEYLERHGTNRR